MNIDNATILVVDDNPTNLSLLLTSLEDVGYRVRIATNGEAALSGSIRVPPDIILLDVIMPGVDGFETCERLKSHPTTRDIPVIFMTAITDSPEEIRGLELGAVDYITKPFHVDTVLARVKTHLTLRLLQRENEQNNLRLQAEIDAREEVQRKLSESQAKLSTLVESTTDLVWSVDCNYELVTGNGAFRRFFHLLPDAAFPATTADGLSQAWQEHYQAALNGNIISTEVAYPPKTLEVVCNPINTDTGVDGVTVFARDISERKQFEAHIKRTNDDLNARVDELTTLNLISQAVTVAEDISAALRHVSRMLTRLLRSTATAIALYNVQSDSYRLTMHSLDESVKDVSLRLTPFSADLNRGESISVTLDAGEACELLPAELCNSEADVAHLLLVPLIAPKWRRWHYHCDTCAGP